MGKLNGLGYSQHHHRLSQEVSCKAFASGIKVSYLNHPVFSSLALTVKWDRPNSLLERFHSMTEWDSQNALLNST